MSKLVLGSLLALTITACGGSAAATAPSTPQPTPVTQTITAGGYSATAHFSKFISFTTPTSGQLNITISWGTASNTLWLDLSSSCTSDEYVAGTCMFVYSDRTATNRPQKTATVNSAPAGTYVLIIDDRGPTDETVKYEVDLTS